MKTDNAGRGFPSPSSSRVTCCVSLYRLSTQSRLHVVGRTGNDPINVHSGLWIVTRLHSSDLHGSIKNTKTRYWRVIGLCCKPCRSARLGTLLQVILYGTTFVAGLEYRLSIPDALNDVATNS